MEKFTRLRASACPIDIENLNTDQLLPARFLKLPRSAGLGKFLFHDLRYNSQGQERPDFPLHQPVSRDARILVGRRNFACGSSREAAVYALLDRGIRCIIAPSFGDIFTGNAVQNGLLAAVVRDEDATALIAALNERRGLALTVDLEKLTVACGDRGFRFTIDAGRRTRLLNGWDDIDLTDAHRDAIAAFKVSDRTLRPWAFPV